MKISLNVDTLERRLKWLGHGAKTSHEEFFKNGGQHNREKLPPRNPGFWAGWKHFWTGPHFGEHVFDRRCRGCRAVLAYSRLKREVAKLKAKQQEQEPIVSMQPDESEVFKTIRELSKGFRERQVSEQDVKP